MPSHSPSDRLGDIPHSEEDTDAVGLSDIATVVGAVGGAAVTTLFDDGDAFGYYSIGLAVGFFAYFAVGLKVDDAKKAASRMVDPALQRRRIKPGPPMMD